jgi:predicted PhzF superfamily epimerase YddE/YHI9
LKPNFPQIAKLKAEAVIVTAKGDKADFVSRCFAPQSGIDEDAVTGSAYTTLTPYWAKRLDKNDLFAVQLSERKGYLRCKYLGDRVEISGKAKLYLIGDIFIEN